ncbi:MAG TPA: class I SAM-dependent methyltransferase [Nocardioidaceae bacterium]|nr:class I SAM-dependent methyltransferase [Nocardioidaceae bacterium]
MTGSAPASPHGGSASIAAPEYWWYRARAELLQVALGPFVRDAARVLDVGSADGPSVGWLRDVRRHTALDIDPRGLEPGGVCGSALALPFRSGCFDVVAAFDVLEHCEPESQVLAELTRVLVPGGRLLLSVPAYEWAWSDFDEDNGHLRRYTRRRAVRAVEDAGLRVERVTYAFTSVFPFFAAERLSRRVRDLLTRRRTGAPADIVSLPAVPAPVERLLMGLSRLDRRLLRHRDLPFGSSVLVAASRPAPGAGEQRPAA